MQEVDAAPLDDSASSAGSTHGSTPHTFIQTAGYLPTQLGIIGIKRAKKSE